MSRGNREWCFTINNWTETDYNQAVEMKNDARYLIFAKEIGEQGTPHLQGYVYFDNAKSLKRMKKYLPRANLSERYVDSTAENCAKYCKKGEQPHAEWVALKDKGQNYGKNADFEEYGQIKQQGKRVDLIEIKNEIVAGRDVEDIMMETPEIYHQYGRTLDKIQDVVLRRKTRTQFTKGIWIHGASGNGKSELVFKNYSHTHSYVWKKDKEWQDGYKQQPLVIIDEFRGQLPFWKLLELADQWTNCWIERRGKEAMPFTSEMVCITSSLKPEEIYKNLDANDKWIQFKRRYMVLDIGDIRQKLIFELELKFLEKK